MAIEIERKFLVDQNRWKPSYPGCRITQGYLSRDIERTVRVRFENNSTHLGEASRFKESAQITIKGRNLGIVRNEFEYPVDKADVLQLLELCHQPILRKTRYKVYGSNNKVWEIDEFDGPLRGLVLAEIELNHETERVELPDWVLREVTADPRFYNSNLSALDHNGARLLLDSL